MRYSVQPCDEGDGRRTWDVRLVERGDPHGGTTHSNHDTRAQARDEARELNAKAAQAAS